MKGTTTNDDHGTGPSRHQRIHASSSHRRRRSRRRHARRPQSRLSLPGRPDQGRLGSLRRPQPRCQEGLQRRTRPALGRPLDDEMRSPTQLHERRASLCAALRDHQRAPDARRPALRHRPRRRRRAGHHRDAAPRVLRIHAREGLPRPFPPPSSSRTGLHRHIPVGSTWPNVGAEPWQNSFGVPLHDMPLPQSASLKHSLRHWPIVVAEAPSQNAPPGQSESMEQFMVKYPRGYTPPGARQYPMPGGSCSKSNQPPSPRSGVSATGVDPASGAPMPGSGGCHPSLGRHALPMARPPSCAFTSDCTARKLDGGAPELHAPRHPIAMPTKPPPPRLDTITGESCRIRPRGATSRSRRGR